MKSLRGWEQSRTLVRPGGPLPWAQNCTISPSLPHLSFSYSFVHSFISRCLWRPVCWVPLRNTVLSSLPIHCLYSNSLILLTFSSPLLPPSIPCPHSPHIVTHLGPSRPVWHSPLQGLGTDGLCLCRDLAPHGHDDGPLGPGQRHGGVGAGAGQVQDWPLWCSAPRAHLYAQSPGGGQAVGA